MENITREAFLEKFWTPYPPMPIGAREWGRLVTIGPSHLEILRNNEIKSLSPRGPESWTTIFRVGDLVALDAEGELVLLSPLKRPLPRRPWDLSSQQRWNAYVENLRSFFRQRDFVEVKTPTLVPCPGTEPSLDVFSTRLQIGSLLRDLYLPTSPELHLKKMLALGAEKIFELAPSFRNGELTEKHQPEFLMLEWYRAYDRLDTIMRDTEELVRVMAAHAGVAGPRQVRRFSVAELFREYCDFDLKPGTSALELKALARKIGVDVSSAESIDDFFFLIFMEKIESRFAPEDLVFVEKYPPYQAALARLTPDGWGERFEAYWKGLELANAFHELNDPDLQRLRFSEDLFKKEQMGKPAVPLDEEFLQCLEAGMPPSAGIALGVERLFMALYDLPHIGELPLFSLKP